MIRTLSPAERAFAVAQRVARATAAVGLRESALDLTGSGLVEGLTATRAALTKAYRQDRNIDVNDEHDALHEEAGYLFGLAVGVALGRGGAR